MIRELAHFVRYGPAVGRRQAALGPTAFLDWLSAEIDATELGALRRRLTEGLHGRVLEVGAGTGTLFARYAPDTRVTAIEPDADFRAAAAVAAASAEAPIRLVAARAEAVPLADDSVDAIVASMVLCSVESVPRALAELTRVLRSGGRLRLLEHVRSERRLAGAVMDATNPIWRRLNHVGCNWNRRTVESVAAAGFRLETVTACKLFHPAVPTAFPWRLIEAVTAG